MSDVFFGHSSHDFFEIGYLTEPKVHKFFYTSWPERPRSPTISSCLHLLPALGLQVCATSFLCLHWGIQTQFLACLHGKRFGDWQLYTQPLFPVFLSFCYKLAAYDLPTLAFCRLESSADTHLTCHLVKDRGNTRQSAHRKPTRFSWEDQTCTHVKMKIHLPKYLSWEQYNKNN